MSYILDALRRAEAERERGEVPSLHTQQYAPPGQDEGRRDGTKTAWLVGGALALALIVVVGWRWLAPESPTRNPAPIAVTTLGTVAAPLATPPTLAPAVPLGPAAPSSFSNGRMSPGLEADESRARAGRNIGADTGTPGRMAPGPGRSARGAGERPAPSPGTDSTARRSGVDSAAAKVDAAASGARVYAQAELPDDVKRSLPALNIGGASYSNDAASRMVIINGQVLHEGDKVADGVVLKQIKLRSSVLTFHSYRFEISY